MMRGNENIKIQMVTYEIFWYAYLLYDHIINKYFEHLKTISQVKANLYMLCL